MVEFAKQIKDRLGIPEDVDAYDTDLNYYLEDAFSDMKASGVPESLLTTDTIDAQVLTAATLYVRAYIGDDRSDTEKYLDLYRKKVFRLTLEDDANAESGD